MNEIGVLGAWGESVQRDGQWKHSHPGTIKAVLLDKLLSTEGAVRDSQVGIMNQRHTFHAAYEHLKVGAASPQFRRRYIVVIEYHRASLDPLDAFHKRVARWIMIDEQI